MPSTSCSRWRRPSRLSSCCMRGGASWGWLSCSSGSRCSAGARGPGCAAGCIPGCRSRFAALAVLPIVLTLELRGASFIGIWMGPAYAGPAGAVLTVLALPVWALAGFHVVTATMIGIDQHRGLIPVFVCEAFMNVLLSIALVHYLGIVGVAWGMDLPRLIVSLFVGPLYVRRHARVPLRGCWTLTLLRPAAGVIA